MTGERQIDYEALAQDALRGIVRTVLMHVARSGGLPGDHHFYIAFSTAAEGVVISKRLKEKYPEEMTIVLQHRFWDLFVNEERFEVKLTFDGIPERLVVPFVAIKVFFDPSVPYGLQFEGSDLTGDAGQDLELEGGEALDIRPGYGATRTRKADALVDVPKPGRAEKKARTPRKPRVPKTEGGPLQPSTKLPAAPSAGSAPDAPSSRPLARPKLVASKPEQPDLPANDTKVVQLDKFRKK
jgi:uncharacterized protein